jgi:hypothetical protein
LHLVDKDRQLRLQLAHLFLEDGDFLGQVL